MVSLIKQHSYLLSHSCLSRFFLRGILAKLRFITWQMMPFFFCVALPGDSYEFSGISKLLCYVHLMSSKTHYCHPLVQQNIDIFFLLGKAHYAMKRVLDSK